MATETKLEAGREMDIRIAEFITGQSRLECRTDPMNREGEPQFYWGYPHGHDFAPPYSTSIAAAWAVVEQFKDYAFELRNSHKPGIAPWIAYIGTFLGTGETAPEAICRAALAAVSGGEQCD